MGASAPETVSEIEQTRARLDAGLKELERRLPAVSAIKRTAAIAAGSGVAGTLVLAVLRRGRKRRKAAEQAHAATIVLNLPEGFPRVPRVVEDAGELKGWLLIAGAVWVVLRLIEIAARRRAAAG
jgi:hypothetical protein